LGRILAQGARFVGVGLVSYPLGLLISAGLHEGLGIPAKVAAAIALGVLLVFNFFLSRHYVFRVRGPANFQLIKFATVSFLMRAIEYVLFLLMLRYTGTHYLMALAAAMAMSAAAKFALYRSFVFGPRSA
jgi:putative flippase GtrA